MSSQTTRKKTPKKKVSKEALKVTALKKRETTIRAMTIIEKMIERKVEEKYLIQSVHFITQDQYQDITEERAITKFCGYPLCCLPLKDIPNKTYHICTKQNKVYDITERKNFCSNGCYKASVYLKNQLLTSPLWLREAEEKPDYRVIHLTDGGGMGDEVDFGHQRIRLSDVTITADDETRQGSSANVSSKTSESHGNGTSVISRKGTKEDGCCDPVASIPGSYSNLQTPVEDARIGTDKNKKSSGHVSKQEGRSARTKEKNLTDLPSVSNEKETVGGVELSNVNKCVIPDTLDSSGIKKQTDSSLASAENAEVKGTCSLQQLEGSESERTTDTVQICKVVSKSEPMLKDLKTNQNEHSSNGRSEEASIKYETVLKEGKPTTGNIIEVSLKEHKIVDQEHAKNEYSCEKGTAESLDSKKNSRVEKSIAVNEIESSLRKSGIIDHKPVGNECSIKEEDSELPSKNKAGSKKESKFKKERHKTKRVTAKDENDEKNGRKMVLMEVVKHIEKCLREWITFDSLILLLGDEAVKTLLQSKGKEFKECQNFCGADSSTYEKYLSICRKLNLLELEDARLDTASKEINADLKPLPDYSLLQREAKQLEIKVRSFYEGSTRIECVEPPVEQSSETENSTIVLPLVDLHAQKALRRRIVLDRLNVVLPDLGRTLNLGIFNLSSSVRHLSQTFNFSSHNITFKPPEWYFIAMVLVKLISLQDRTLKAVIETDTAEKYLTLLLMNWGLDAGYLDRLITWLTDVDFLIQKTD